MDKPRWNDLKKQAERLLYTLNDVDVWYGDGVGWMVVFGEGLTDMIYIYKGMYDQDLATASQTHPQLLPLLARYRLTGTLDG